MTTYERMLRQIALTTTERQLPRANAISRRAFAGVLGLLAFGRPLHGSAVMVDCGTPICTSSGGRWHENACGNCDEVELEECECMISSGYWVFCCSCTGCNPGQGPEECSWNNNEIQFPTHDCFDPSCDSQPPCECDKPEEWCPDSGGS